MVYLALGGSVLLCFPCGCFNGVLSAVGLSSIVFPNFETGSTAAENSSFTVIFGVIALLALIPGAILFAWGLRTLRQEPQF